MTPNKSAGSAEGVSSTLLPKGLRWSGALLAALYGAGVALHKAISKPKWAPIATLCVGNLTTGGTGKTPAVIYLARELARRGRKPAILMRGYKAQGGDEAREAAGALAGLGIPIVLGAERYAGALKARALGCDVALLDDGFQHWALARDLDIVLLDSNDPFGGGALLPQGRLREPAGGLARAGVVLLTRSNASGANAQTLAKLTELAPRAAILSARHAPVGLRALNSAVQKSVTELRGLSVAAACGIGNPQAFFSTLEECGARISSTKTFADHHDYSAKDVAQLGALAASAQARAIVVTEKDAVKLEQLKLPATPEFLALKIEFEIEQAGPLWERVEDALGRGDKRA